MMLHRKSHFVLVTFPAQGHINPALQFAKRLVRAGADQVTFATSVSAHRRMLDSSSSSSNSNNNLLNYNGSITFSPFSDGYDDGFPSTNDDDDKYVQGARFLSEFKRRGSEAITELVLASAKDQSRCPVTCLIYTILLPWAGEVARDLGLPSALLWIQPAFVFDIYYYYFNGYKHVIEENDEDPSYSVELPGLPVLTCRDLPSFLLPSNPYSCSSIPMFEEQFQCLKREETNIKRPRVLVNTFDALEPDALKALDGKVDFMAIGPLIPSAFLDGKDPSDTCFGGDIFHGSNSKEYYFEWLNSKAEASVVYVSFGSLVALSKKQMEEIARGLVESGRPFLWVVPDKKKNRKKETEEEEVYVESLIGSINKEEQGLVLRWCSQIEVLSHPSIGCFVSHCGWNSTLESLALGVPMVAFPQWTDQGTNAKLIEDIWKIGVRVRVDREEENFVKGEELKRCVEIVLGEDLQRREEIRRNADKWKDLARKAAEDGGSSERNLTAFLQDIGEVSG